MHGRRADRLNRRIVDRGRAVTIPKDFRGRAARLVDVDLPRVYMWVHRVRCLI